MFLGAGHCVSRCRTVRSSELEIQFFGVAPGKGVGWSDDFGVARSPLEESEGKPSEERRISSEEIKISFEGGKFASGERRCALAGSKKADAMAVISPKSYIFATPTKQHNKKVMNKINSVCVYCASSTKIDSAYFDAARELGTLLGKKHIRVINGAGNMGLMAAVSDAALAADGEVTGVIPQFMVEQGWHHTGLTELIEVADMHERKRTMVQLSDAIIALPGGCGTLEELLEVITWKQLGLYLNPIVILNVKGYFNPLIDMFRKAMDENFMRVQHGNIWSVAGTAQDAVELIHTTPLWDVSIRKFAAI